MANLVEADVLVILTDQRGLYSADPRKDPQAQFISLAEAGDPRWRRWLVVPARASAVVAC